MNKQPLNIVIIPSWYFPKGSNAIAGYLFFEHTKALRERGIEARIAYAGFSASSWPLKNNTFELENGVPTWRGNGWFPPKRNQFIIQKWIKKSGTALIKHFKSEGQPGVMHAQGYQAAWIAEFVFHETGIPYIVSEHNSSFLQGNIPSIHKDYIRSSYLHAALITAVSTGLKEAMQEYSSNHDIHVVPNDYDSRIFYPPAQRYVKRGPFQWITAGEPIFTKGLDILLLSFSQVVRHYPDVPHKLVLADNIPHVNILKRQASKLGILPYIHFAGLLLPEQLAELMRNSHVLVSSSRFETFGRTMIEANACGIPVVATRTAGADFILQQDIQGLLCDVSSVDSLAEAMVMLYESYEQYNPTEILSAVQSRFHQDIVSKQWIQYYQNICNVN